MLNQDARKTKDPQLTELTGLMNVKDFSKTIVLAEAVGFAYILQAARAQACARLRIPPAGRAGALLACSAVEKKKPSFDGFFFESLAEAVGFEPTIQV